MKIFIFVLFLIFTSLNLQAQIYYVNSDSSTSGNGLSRVNAYVTLQEALATLGTAGAGATIICEGSSAGYSFGNSDQKVECNGTEKQWVNIIGEKGAFIKKDAFGEAAITFNNASYTRVTGFKFESNGGGTDYRAGSIYFTGSNDNIEIVGNNFVGVGGTDAGAFIIINTTSSNVFNVSFIGNTFHTDNDASSSNAAIIRGQTTTTPAGGSLLTFNKNTVARLAGTRNDAQEGVIYIDNRLPIKARDNIFAGLEFDDGDPVVFFTDSWDEAETDIDNNVINFESSGTNGAGLNYDSGDEGTVYTTVATFVNNGSDTFYEWTLSGNSDYRFMALDGGAMGAIPPFILQIGSLR